MIEIKISVDFSNTLGGRYIEESPNSGQQFRNDILEPKYIEAKEKNEKKLFTQSGKSEATLTTRFPVSDFLTKKERCYVSAFQKTANDIRELSMTLNSIVSLYSEKKTNSKVT